MWVWRVECGCEVDVRGVGGGRVDQVWGVGCGCGLGGGFGLWVWGDVVLFGVWVGVGVGDKQKRKQKLAAMEIKIVQFGFFLDPRKKL